MSSIILVMRNSQTPLTPREEDAFECLREAVDGDDCCRRTAAIDTVANIGFDDDEAVYLVNQLISKGYLYTVHGEVRITF